MHRRNALLAIGGAGLLAVAGLTIGGLASAATSRVAAAPLISHTSTVPWKPIVWSYSQHGIAKQTGACPCAHLPVVGANGFVLVAEEGDLAAGQYPSAGAEFTRFYKDDAKVTNSYGTLADLGRGWSFPPLSPATGASIGFGCSSNAPKAGLVCEATGWVGGTALAGMAKSGMGIKQMCAAVTAPCPAIQSPTTANAVVFRVNDSAMITGFYLTKSGKPMASQLLAGKTASDIFASSDPLARVSR